MVVVYVVEDRWLVKLRMMTKGQCADMMWSQWSNNIYANSMMYMCVVIAANMVCSQIFFAEI